MRALRRLSDLVTEVEFLQLQLHVVRDSGPPHHLRDVGVRIAALHQRLDVLERQLRQRAQSEGQDSKAALSEVLRRLSAPDSAASSHGPERRRRALRRNMEGPSLAQGRVHSSR